MNTDKKSLRFAGADGTEMELDMATGAMRKVRQKMLVDKLLDFDSIKFIRDNEHQQTKAIYENAVIEENGIHHAIFGIGSTANEAIREMLNDMKGEVILKGNHTYTIDEDGNFIQVSTVSIGA